MNLVAIGADVIICFFIPEYAVFCITKALSFKFNSKLSSIGIRELLKCTVDCQCFKLESIKMEAVPKLPGHKFSAKECINVPIYTSALRKVS